MLHPLTSINCFCLYPSCQCSIFGQMWEIPEFCCLSLANYIVFVAKSSAGMLMVVMQMHGSFATG